MKKNTQIVLGGAVVLGLAAGGGTFAAWNASTNVDGGGVTTGQLGISADATVSFKDVSTGVTNPAWAANDLMVPGDTVQQAQDFHITLKGKNLKAKLTLVNAAATIPAALKDDVVVTYQVQKKGTPVAASGWKPAGASIVLADALTPGSTDAVDYTVTVQYAFADKAGQNPGAQGNLTVALPSAAQLQLDQVR